jgi:hypothetical protein
MKDDPEDLRRLAEDLQGSLQRHSDAVRNNPDIATDIVKVRDRAIRRYEEVSEGRPQE